ncbi:hypothetical protein VTG60DRAFT_4531 [Thermothelomyces hinnuleus]
MISQHLVVAVVSALLLWTGPARGKSAPDEFVGRGRIQVLNATDYATASIADRIGCMNADGRMTLRDCAVFTQLPNTPFSLSTSAGNCTTQNPDMPRNTDSVYGKNSYAWWCGQKGDWEQFDEYYYTINGFPAPYICTGDIGCYWDVKAVVPAEGDALPAWRYFWGGQQMDIEPGHWKVLWLWVPVGDDE